jgi:hypothetical protein
MLACRFERIDAPRLCKPMVRFSTSIVCGDREITYSISRVKT